MEIDNEVIKRIKITPLLDTLRLEDISDDEYFSEKYSKYISNSRLGLLKSKGAAAFFEGLKNDGSYNSSFAFGSALHELVLQPESFELIDSVFKPTAKAGIVADYLYKSDGSPVKDDDIKIASIKCNYYKDKLTTNRLYEFKLKAEPYWRDRYIYEQNNPLTKDSKFRIYTDEKSVGLLKSCLNAVNKDENIQNLLKPQGILGELYSANERTILLDVEISIPNYESRIYKLKSKLDNFTIDNESNVITINDLKTTSKLAKEFDPTFFSYQRELGMYSVLLRYCSEKFFNLKNPMVKGNFLVVSIIPDFNTLVYPMTNELFKSGISEFMYLLKCVAYLNIVKGYEFAN